MMANPTLPLNAPGADAHDNPDVASDPQTIADSYDFIGQYIDQFSDGDGQPSYPPFSYQEAKDDIAAQTPSNGPLQILSIFETNGLASTIFNEPGQQTDAWENYLTYNQGVTDAEHAYTSAKDIGQPFGSAIYFAMDFDPAGYNAADWTNPDNLTPGTDNGANPNHTLDEPTILTEVYKYFQGVESVLNSEPSGQSYTVGVYGAVDILLAVIGQLGTVTQTTLAGDSTPLATYTWRTQAVGWAGSYSNQNGSPYAGSTTTDNKGNPFSIIQEPGSGMTGNVPVDPDTNQAAIIGTWDTQMPPPCYVTGTRILTERGEVAVEDLRIGDRVMALRSGGLVPVQWIGHRRVDLRNHPRPSSVYPVRVAAGAFAEGRPYRDLWLSPGHSVFVDGVLIQIEKLVNGATIAQVPQDEVTYWHVELATHDILLAEGLAAESYLDTGNRTAFTNGGAFLDLHPDFAPRHWTQSCVPLVQSGPQLAAVKRGLLERAIGLFGHATTTDHELRLVAHGRAIAPEVEGDLYRFAVPPGISELRLVSRSWVPSELGPNSSDARRLGVCVRRLLLDGREMPLDAGALEEGWHGPEGDGPQRWRWTGGAARLQSGAATIAVELCNSALYWTEAAPNRVATAHPEELRAAS
ncbi:MAG: Hint domain-containing protein [Alphaproteobacteria bacterium]|nr:Hint domain-containing protein [Alphaproteobacteria bacterium]